jgi:riboflavin synthase
MFTGLVAGRGVVCDVRPDAAGPDSSALVESSARAQADTPIRLTIRVPADFGGEGRLGESVCINGCCLTAVAFEGQGEQWAFQAGSETLSKTNLGLLRSGDVVNLERALPVDGRFGGHFVQGHVDGVGHVDRTQRDGEWVTVWFRAPEPLIEQLVPKGSVAVDGVSLTVVNVERGRFSVALVPHTLEVTTLGIRKPGDSVNLETDILGKYVQKFLLETKQGEMKQGT